MTDQTSGAEKVRLPNQARPAQRGTADAAQGYQPRHRAAASAATDPSAEALDGPRVVAPSGHLASQRKAVAASTRARVVTPRRALPDVPLQVRRVYDTPVWVPTGRGEQPEPHLALVEEDTEALARPAGMIRSARWTSAHRVNVAAGLLLLAFLVVAAAFLSGLLGRQSTPTLALTLACLLGAAGTYSLLVVLRPRTVELSEPWLSVHRGDRHDRFNLASPFQVLELSGRPGSRRWRLALGCADGRTVHLRRWMVDSEALDVVIRYGQAVAAAERAAREDRFRR